MSGIVKYLGVQDEHRVKDRSLAHGAYQVSKTPSFPRHTFTILMEKVIYL